MDLEKISITKEKFLEIARQINNHIKSNYSNINSMRSTKANFTYALRLFIKYKYGNSESKDILVRLKPKHYSYK